MFDRAKFQKVFKYSGLTKDELASLYGVTRQSIYDWLGPSVPTQKTLIAKEQAVTTGLLAAIERGVLPMRGVTDKKIRAERIRIMAQQLHVLAQPK